jgi:hypothetical protein
MRAEARLLQQMEHLLQLQEHRPGRGALQLKPAQVLQVGQHVQQRRAETGVQQAQVVVNTLGHGSGFLDLPPGFS